MSEKKIMNKAFELKRRRHADSDNSLFDCRTNEPDVSEHPLIFYSVKSLFKMHKNAKIGLIGSSILVFFAVVILLSNLKSFKSNPSQPSPCVALDGEKTCFATNLNPYRNYGSKTAYHVVSKDQDTPIELENCSPKVFYMLSRHATRYPDEIYIKYINKYLPDLKEKILKSYKDKKVNLCEEDINKFKEWYSAMKISDQNTLSQTGSHESEGLGKRLRKKFSSILSMPYSSETFVIEYTSRERTKHTAKNFAKGMFSEKEYKKINFTGNINDKVLQFHRDCNTMKKDCENSDYNIAEVEKFKNGTLMRKVVSSVSKRIGFNVTFEDVRHMKVACVFGFALNISDAWCAVFSTDDLKVLEFYDDIDDYYKDAYGNVINYEQACPVVKYIVDLFRSYESKQKRKVVLHFSHAGALKKVYSALGLFHDDHPLTADNFCDLKKRKWRTSLILPFNSNIVILLYDCSGELKFVTLHNEKPVIIDGCDNEICSLRKFYEKYENVGEKCNLKEICDVCKI